MLPVCSDPRVSVTGRVTTLGVGAGHPAEGGGVLQKGGHGGSRRL